MIRTSCAAIGLAAISSLSFIAADGANAAEIRLLHPGVLTGFVKATVPAFEKSSGHTVTTAAGTSGALTSRIRKGEVADVLIVPAGQVKQLTTEGMVVPGTQIAVATVGMGVGVRKSASKPDVGTVDALKRALLAATSIGFPDPADGAPTGIHVAKMIADMGIAAELKPKIKLFGSGPETSAALAKGEVELGFSQMTDLAGNPNIVVAGSLPAPFQGTTHLAGGILAASQQRDAAKALLTFLTSPAARSALTARGFE